MIVHCTLQAAKLCFKYYNQIKLFAPPNYKIQQINTII